MVPEYQKGERCYMVSLETYMHISPEIDKL